MNILDLIQELKNEMQTECNAHTAETKYTYKFNSDGIKIDSRDLSDYNKGYMFKEKVDLLKQIGMEIVADTRKALAKKRSKSVQ